MTTPPPPPPEAEASSGDDESYRRLQGSTATTNSTSQSDSPSTDASSVSTEGLDLSGCGTSGGSRTVAVAIDIVTLNQEALEMILAGLSGDATTSNILGSSVITNSANQSFTSCTPRVRVEQSREITPAPPPQTASGLVLADFVNVSNPAAAAVGQLLRASAATASAAATAVAVTATASALAGGASGMSPAGLLSVQRLSLYSKMSGVPETCDDPAASAVGGAWYTGSLGVAGTNPCTAPPSSASGRRLTSKGSGKSDGTAEPVVGAGEQVQEDLPVQLLVSTMIDAIVSATIILSVVTGLHLLALLCWRFCVNRAYYRWRPPGFTRTVRIDKGTGIDAGVSLRGGRITGIAEGSPCSSVLSCGDKLVLINGKKVARTIWGCFSPSRLSNAGAQKVMRDAPRLLLLVTSPPLESDGDSGAPPTMLYTSARVAPFTEPQPKAPLPSADADAIVMSRVAMRRLPKRLQAKYERGTRALKTRPSFHPLPEPFVFPNLELTFALMTSTGMVQASASVLAAWAGGYRAYVQHVIIAVGAVVFNVALFAHQGYMLFVFSRHHNEHTWVPADKPQARDELEDPLFALMSRLLCGMMPLVPRERGSYEPPEDDNAEPDRTERALNRVFSWRQPRFRNRPHGDAMVELATWLGDSSGSSHGLWFLYFLALVQVILAGFTGVMYALPWGTTTLGGQVWIGCLLVIAITNVTWTACQTANDRIDGLEKFLCFALEGASIGLLLTGAILKSIPFDPSVPEATAKEERLLFTLDLATWASRLMLAVVFVPFPITVYNSFIVPIFNFVMKAEGDCRETCSQALLTMILLPCDILSNFCGFSSSTDILAELEGAIIDTTASDISIKNDAPDEEGGADDMDEEEYFENAEQPGSALEPIRAVPATSVASTAAAAITAGGKEPGPLSKGAKARMKREEFVACMRAKRANKQAGSLGSTDRTDDGATAIGSWAAPGEPSGSSYHTQVSLERNASNTDVEDMEVRSVFSTPRDGMLTPTPPEP